MKKILIIFTYLFILNNMFCQTVENSETDIINQSEKYNIIKLQNEIEILKNSISDLKSNNLMYSRFYEESQSSISLTVNIFMIFIGGAFILFVYLFKRPDLMWKKVKNTEKKAKIILNGLNLKIEKIDFLRKHQETIFILNKKSLFNYTDEDWNLVNIFSENASDLEENNRTFNDWIFLGLSAYRKITLRKSVEAFKKAIEINPNSEIAWKHLGTVYDKNHQIDKAISAYKKVIELNPNNDVAYNNLAIEYVTLGKFEEAQGNFLKAIRLNPNNCYVYTNYFEACLVNNVPLDNKLVEVFKDRFSDNKSANASFEMLNIYDKIIKQNINDLNIELKKWRANYQTLSWDESFRDIETWINSETVDPKYKKDLMYALNFFSSDSPFKNRP
ncbi:tetratricopeptide repeat protein [Kordia sp. YSTF-M3]|uniref:Tetratricopeptide repeat protein n=1 Tax=Kordia aestuariivivens TaxID=2759037 RepID=A0ABR7Q580_9FLAO|nr:tetratricopeptide repeat protein [Kordia aestuariivivens]MBC8753702.1 tetratricopeptide repeat protein [Kordia aestuariivivens]